jgi:hypothetical protein
MLQNCTKSVRMVIVTYNLMFCVWIVCERINTILPLLISFIWFRNSPPFMEPKTSLSFHRCQSLVPTLGQINLAHILTSIYFKIRFNIILLSKPWSTKLSLPMNVSKNVGRKFVNEFSILLWKYKQHTHTHTEYGMKIMQIMNETLLLQWNSFHTYIKTF